MNAPAPIGHNVGPITLPKDEEMLADLQKRYADIDTRIAEWDGALKDFPDDIPLDQEDVAQSLQDLLGQIKKDSRRWDADAKGEKSPLNKLVKIVGNFFTTRVEKADAMLEKWAAVHQAFLDKKKVEATRKAEEEAQHQREIEANARAAAERAVEEQRQADIRIAERRREEEEARAAAARAEEEKKAAEARAEAFKAEERRLAEEKRIRDRDEKERNNSGLREIRNYMKRVETLFTLVQADEASEDEIKELDNLARAGGIIGNLASPVANSLLLDDEQKTSIEGTRTRLYELRTAINENIGKREKAKREKEAREAEAKEAALVEQRRIAREAEDKRMAEARAAREVEEKAAEDAAEVRRAEQQKAREARDAANVAHAETKAAGKGIKAATVEADRAANRGDRIENRLEKSTDADLSRTRGELGTVGSLTRRWAPYIVDEAALRVVCGPLGEHFTTTALEGATFHWMRAHQAGWSGRERVEDSLAGCVFAYEQEARIA